MKWLVHHRFSYRHARIHEGGIGIISKYPIDTIITDDVIGRVTAALAQTPIGSMPAGSTHLTCCGAIGGSLIENFPGGAASGPRGGGFTITTDIGVFRIWV